MREDFKKTGKGNECSLMTREGKEIFEQQTCYLNIQKNKNKK